jgi:O-antigen/teichoic acid export membrane protein
MNSFNKNVVTLVSGNAIALLLPIVFYPVLSRVFSPADYALFGLYISVFSFLEIASAGRYDFAVVMPSQDEDAINLVAGGFLISVLFSIFILVLVSFTKDILATSLRNPNLANWLFLLPPALLLVSISKLCNAWLIRIKKFKSASVNKVSQKSAEVSAQLLFGFIRFGNGLVFGDFAGKLFNAGFSIHQSIKSGLNKKLVSISSIRVNLKRYSELPKYNILPSMLNTLGGMLPVFIISRYYAVEESGSFNFSRIILSLPFALIANGISQVISQDVSEKKNNHQPVFKDVLSLVLKLSVLSLIGIITLHFLGAELFEWVFGVKWRLAGEYTSILIFSYAISFMVSPFSMLLVILGKIKWASLWQVFYFSAVCLLWFLNDLPITQFLIALVAIDILAYLLYGLLIYRTIRIYDQDFITHLK